MAISITSTRLSVHLGSTAHAPPAISSRDLAVYAVKQVQLPKGGGSLACQLYAWILVYTPYFVLDHTKFKRIISDSFLICETCKWALNIYYLYTQERVTYGKGIKTEAWWCVRSFRCLVSCWDRGDLMARSLVCSDENRPRGSIRKKKPEWGWSAYTAGLWQDGPSEQICFPNKVTILFQICYSDFCNAASCKLQGELKTVTRA